jgi:hypothetical protein
MSLLQPPPGLKNNIEKKFENDMIRTAFICAEFVLRGEEDDFIINEKVMKSKREEYFKNREQNKKKYVYRKNINRNIMKKDMVNKDTINKNIIHKNIINIINKNMER